jgi:hypothetical protein
VALIVFLKPSVILHIELISRKCLAIGLSVNWAGDSLLNEAVTRRQETRQNGRRYVIVPVLSVLTTPETCRRAVNRIKRLIIG